MVKIKTLSIIIGLIVALFALPVALAQEDNVGVCVTRCKLFITDVDVKVGTKSDKNLEDGDSISDEAAPGDTVQFKIKIYNNFTDNEDVDIDDVQVTVTIEGIDDDDDLEEEASEFDLKADKDKTVTITFKIPLEVDEDTFDVVITAEGDSDNGSQEVEMTLDLDVEKESNEIRFTRNSVSPSEVQCSRSVQLSSSLINTGSDEEDDVELEISNSDLGVSFSETFDLSNDPFDEDSKFSKTFSFTVPDSVRAGNYPIESRVTFNDGTDVETEAVDLVVRSCDVAAEEEPAEEEDSGEVVVVTPPTTQQPTTPGTAQPVTPPTLPSTEESIFQSNGFLIALIVGEVMLVLIAILIVVAVARRRS